MIASLKGILSQKSSNSIIVDVNGVGYEVILPQSALVRLPLEGQPIELLIYTHVAEGILCLYGFLSTHEKSLFKSLLSVSGIGPKLALSVLSGLPATDLVEAIAGENLVKLTAISGIGKKTAERLIMELKDKAAKWMIEGEMGGGKIPFASKNRAYDEALSALINLGYNRQIAERALTNIAIGHDSTVEYVIRESLNVLSK